MHSSLFKIRGQRDNKLIQATTQMDKNENNYQLGLNLFFLLLKLFHLWESSTCESESEKKNCYNMLELEL